MPMKTGDYPLYAIPLCKLMILLIVAFALSACATEVHTRIWESAKSNGYPEHYDKHLKEFLHSNITSQRNLRFGIAFSGGGTRSASATLGQIRALYQLGIMQKADYVSAVSGGGWTVVPFIYRPRNIKGENFFDEYVTPRKITTKNLRCNKKNSMGDAIANTKFNFFSNNIYYMGVVGRHDEIYARYLGNLFLKPFGLKCGFKTRFFTWTKEYWKKNIKEDHPNLSEDDFLFVHDMRPYLIVNTTLMPFRSGNSRYFLPLEITPAYVGVPIDAKLIIREENEDNEEQSKSNKTIELGGYIEPMAYDSRPPLNPDTQHKNTVIIESWSKRFTLSDVLASTGAAPQQTLHKTGILKPITTNLGMPEFRYWGVKTKDVNNYFEYPHGDGGHLDNLGLLPLLARKVERILVFINTPTKYGYKKGRNKPSIDSGLVSLFNLKNNSNYSKVFRRHPHNIVFSENAFNRLIQGFDKKLEDHNGEPNRNIPNSPLVYCDTYSIVENKRFNVTRTYDFKEKKTNHDKGVYAPKICWVYLSNAKAWLEEIEKNTDIDNEIKYSILNKKGEFRHFPHYWTFANDLPKLTVIDKSHAQVNLLSNLTHWVVKMTANDITKYLGLGEVKPKDEYKTKFDGRPSAIQFGCDEKYEKTNELILETTSIRKGICD